MKDIKNFEGLYAATEDGKIWSHRRQIYLKPRVRKDGYLDVCLRKDNKNHTLSIHRLIAETYIENPDNLPQVGHLDETRDNNCVSNLYWTTAKENSNTPLHKKRLNPTTKKAVECIELGTTYESAAEAARAMGLNHSHISSCCRGDRQIHGGYHWRYING